MLAEVARSGAFVPDLWEYEVLDALLSSTRRGRLTQVAVRTALPLATLDTAVADAARRLGVPVVG